MTDWARDQLDVLLVRFVGEFFRKLIALSVNLFWSTELQVNLIRIMNELADGIHRKIVGQVAAHFLREGKLSIGKRAGACPSIHDAACLAVCALPTGAGRASPVVDAASRIHHQHLLFGCKPVHLQCRKNPRRAGTDNQ